MLHQLRDRQRPRKGKQKMHVIFHSANLQRMASVVAKDPDQIEMQFLANIRIENRRTVLRAENDVDQNIGERLGHGDDCIAPLQGLANSLLPTQACGLGFRIPALRAKRMPEPRDLRTQRPNRSARFGRNLDELWLTRASQAAESIVKQS